MGTLSKELAFFTKHKESLIKEHENEFVLIKKDKIIGFFSTSREAIDRGRELFPNLPIFVGRLEKNDDPHKYYARGMFFECPL